MNAGDLDRRLTLRRATISMGSYNESVETWGDLATVWASKQDISDAERDRAGQVGATRTTRFRIRYSTTVADVNPKDQLICEGRLYQITATKEIDRRVGIEITATALADT